MALWRSRVRIPLGPLKRDEPAGVPVGSFCDRGARVGRFWDALAYHKRFPQAPRSQPSNGFGNRNGEREDWSGKLEKAVDLFNRALSVDDLQKLVGKYDLKT